MFSDVVYITGNKKLSYRRESMHLTLLYYTMQKALRYVEPFTRGSQV